MTKIYYNEDHQQLLNNGSFSNIKPGDIILFSAVGRNRKARIHDNLIMFMQSIFKWEYQPKQHRANAGITHAAICVSSDPIYGPTIVEVNRRGRSKLSLTGAFYHKPETGSFFRPMHVFSPTDESFKKKLAEVTDSAPRIHNKSEWSVGRAACALFTRPKKNNGKGVDRKDDKPFKNKTHCSDLVVRAMKNSARELYRDKELPDNKANDYFPDLHTNITPSSLLSYLLQKVGEGKYAHSIYVDIDPYKGIQDAINEQIRRLDKDKSDSAIEKAGKLSEALKSAIKSIDESAEKLDSIEKAQSLFKAMRETLEYKRSNYNPFKKATTFVAVQNYLNKAIEYTQKLRY